MIDGRNSPPLGRAPGLPPGVETWSMRDPVWLTSEEQYLEGEQWHTWTAPGWIR
jgi:hypothetical protein